MARESDAMHDVETLVIAGLNLLPGIGGALASVYERTSQRTRENIAVAGAAAIAEAGDEELLLRRIQEDERLSYLFMNVCEAAARSAVAEKKLLLGKLLGRAVRDEAEIDKGELAERILRDLEGPHLRAMSELADAADATRAGGEVSQHAFDEVMDKYPSPVRAALERNGLLATVGTYGGGEIVIGLNEFGRWLLEEVRAAGAESPLTDDAGA
jgi:hypothetical protein